MDMNDHIVNFAIYYLLITNIKNLGKKLLNNELIMVIYLVKLYIVSIYLIATT